MTDRLTRQQSRLVEQHVEMARRVAIGIWKSKGGDQQELVSLAFMGLVEAASRYEPSRGPFENFAKSRIRGSILDAARSADHVPRSVRARYKAGDTTVTAAVEAKPVHISDELTAQLSGHYDTDQEAQDNQVLRATAAVVSSLPVEQQAVLALHYYADMELKEIARYFQVPVSRVGQLHIRGVMAVADRLRELL